tara:strand:- start:46 stop:435 length:390 start_codon:yes stop_codon:yes gene_type:complete
MITWQWEECSIKLLFHRPLEDALTLGRTEITKLSDFRNRKGLYQVTVKFKESAMTSAIDWHGKENVAFASRLIMDKYGLSQEEANSWAVKALDGLESHGFSANDHDAVKEVVRVVVSSWLSSEGQKFNK